MGMFARARNAAINRVRGGKEGISLSDIGSVGATPIPAAGMAAVRRKSRSFAQPAPMPDASQRRMMGKRAGAMDQSKFAGRQPEFQTAVPRVNGRPDDMIQIPESGKRAAMLAQQVGGNENMQRQAMMARRKRGGFRG